MSADPMTLWACQQALLEAGASLFGAPPRALEAGATLRDLGCTCTRDAQELVDQASRATRAPMLVLKGVEWPIADVARMLAGAMPRERPASLPVAQGEGAEGVAAPLPPEVPPPRVVREIDPTRGGRAA